MEKHELFKYKFFSGGVKGVMEMGAREPVMN